MFFCCCCCKVLWRNTPGYKNQELHHWARWHDVTSKLACDTWDTGLAYKQNKIMWVSWILDLLLADDDKTAVFVHKQHKNLLWVAFYRFCQTKFSAWLPVSYRSSGNLDKSSYLAWIWKISNFSVRTFVTRPSIHPYLYLALHLFLLRTMDSDLKVLIFISVTSLSAVNHFSVRPQSNKFSRTTSSTKSKDVILQPPRWKP